MFLGPKYQSKPWEPIKLIANVPIIPRTVKFGLSCRGINTSKQIMIPPSAPINTPEERTIIGWSESIRDAKYAPYPAKEKINP